MRKRPKLLLLVAALGLVLTLGTLLLRDPEPGYQGRSLSQWYVLWAENTQRHDAESEAHTRQAAQAIRQIDTNALPLLLKELRRRTAISHGLLDSIVNKLPEPFLDSTIVSALLSPHREVEPTIIFFILGEQGAPAVPELATLMGDTNNEILAHTATYCLAALGKAGLPSLLAALANPHLPSCYHAAYWLAVRGPASFGTNIAQAVPLLAQCTGAKDRRLAHAAITALGRIRMEPQISVPALTNSLQSPNPFIRAAALQSLSGFGDLAIPVLVSTLNDPDRSVRYTATNSLETLQGASPNTAAP